MGVSFGEKGILIGIFLALLLPSAWGANITGTAYNGLTLDPLQNAIITISTSPQQVKLAKDGTYAFDVPIGEYTLKATFAQQGVIVLQSEEVITISQDGTYVVDLILLPDVNGIPEDPLPDDNTPTIWEQLINGPFPILVILILLLAGAGIFYLNWKKMSHVRKTEPTHHEGHLHAGEGHEHAHTHVPVSTPPAEYAPDKYAWEVLDALNRGGHRLTQKEIREKMNVGEAKVSLIISELESTGYIKKIKKGRGNIVVLTEKGIREAEKHVEKKETNEGDNIPIPPFP